MDLGVKIDPRVHDIYQTENKAKELISVPLDTDHTIKNLNDSLEKSLYICRTLLQARRLLSLYLLTQSSHPGILFYFFMTKFGFYLLFFFVLEFFEVTSKAEDFDKMIKPKNDLDTEPLESVRFGSSKAQTEKSSKDKISFKINDYFHSNPVNFADKTFENKNEVFISDININLNTVIESYTKSIGKIFFGLLIYLK